MAIGDVTPTELIVPSALSATATAKYTNVATNRVELTGLWICNTGASQRTITIYKNGTALANQISAIVLPAASSALIDLVGKALVFTGTQTLAAKQDTGTDVNIAAYGIVEQIA